jgi:hypothetical protein
VSRCIASGEWVLDNYCDSGEWTTRTKLLADTMLGLQSDNFILHCDNAVESLNDASRPQPFITASRINGFCSISDSRSLQSGTTIAVGTTLNGNQGVSLSQLDNSDTETDPLFAQQGTQTFVKILNSTRLDAAARECANIRDLTAQQRNTNAFIPCDADEGSVLYNPKTSTLIFTTAEDTLITNLNAGATTRRLREVRNATLAGGDKIYIAQSGARKVDGVLQPEGELTSAGPWATVGYRGIDINRHFAARRGANPWTLDNSTSTHLVRMNLTRVSAAAQQSSWEYFTLAIRP